MLFTHIGMIKSTFTLYQLASTDNIASALNMSIGSTMQSARFMELTEDGQDSMIRVLHFVFLKCFIREWK